MNSIKKSIVFLFCSTIVSLLLTYFFSIVEFTNKLISSNFLFTVLSGIFASFIVLLIVETKKYFDAKRENEDKIYFYLMYLYAEFVVEIGNVSIYLDNEAELVPGNLFQARMPIMSNYGSALRAIDYSPFRKTKLFRDIKSYQKNELPNVDKHVHLQSYLPQAIALTKLEYVQSGALSYNPIAADRLVKTTLIKIKIDAEMQRVCINQLLETIDAELSNRYNWSKDKEFIDNMNLSLEEREKMNKDFFEN